MSHRDHPEELEPNDFEIPEADLAWLHKYRNDTAGATLNEAVTRPMEDYFLCMWVHIYGGHYRGDGIGPAQLRDIETRYQREMGMATVRLDITDTRKIGARLHDLTKRGLIAYAGKNIGYVPLELQGDAPLTLLENFRQVASKIMQFNPALAAEVEAFKVLHDASPKRFQREQFLPFGGSDGLGQPRCSPTMSQASHIIGRRLCRTFQLPEFNRSGNLILESVVVNMAREVGAIQTVFDVLGPVYHIPTSDAVLKNMLVLQGAEIRIPQDKVYECRMAAFALNERLLACEEEWKRRRELAGNEAHIARNRIMQTIPFSERGSDYAEAA